MKHDLVQLGLAEARFQKSRSALHRVVGPKLLKCHEPNVDATPYPENHGTKPAGCQGDVTVEHKKSRVKTEET